MLLLNKFVFLFGLSAFAVSLLFAEDSSSKEVAPNEPISEGLCFLSAAVGVGDVGVVDSLLKGGYPFVGRTTFANEPAYLALVTNKADIFYLLLEAGLAKEINKNQESFSGWSILSIAAMHDSARCVELALFYKADVNNIDASGFTPLFLAIRHRSERSFLPLAHGGGLILAEELDQLKEDDVLWARQLLEMKDIKEIVRSDEEAENFNMPKSQPDNDLADDP